MRRPIDINQIPPAPPASILNPQHGYFSIVLPVARTNLVLNPSVEIDTVGYTADGGGTMARVAGVSAHGPSASYHGAYGLSRTPGAGTDGWYYTTSTLASGTTYAASVKFLGIPGVKYKFSIATTGGVDLIVSKIVATGRWQWVWLFYKETANAARRLYVKADSDNRAITAAFYADGLQLEACGSEGVFVTTFIDGDQQPLISGQFPPPYAWNGTPHASTSYRLATTRAGGRVVNLDLYKYKVAGFLGLGVTLVANIGTAPGALDGAQFQSTIARSRSFVVNGFLDATTEEDLDRQRTLLANALGPDSTQPRQPAVLIFQKYDCERPVGAAGRIVASYERGLEETATNPFREDTTLTFTQWLPSILAGDSGAALTTQSNVTNANMVVRRTPGGQWSPLSTGVSGPAAVVYAIAPHPNGTVYIGGVFTDAGGSGADYAAIYNPVTDTFTTVKAATSFNNTVRAIAIGPDGKVYFGGLFTNADGIAAADGIVAYDPVANTFAALGTGVGGGGEVYVLTFGPNGVLYAGGDFGSMGGVANTGGIAQWSGTVWATMGGASANNTVRAILVQGNTLYAGGLFTGIFNIAANRIASWDVAAAVGSALGTGANSTVNSFALGADGLLYIAGNFTTLNGVAIQYIATWNGAAFNRVGDATALNAAVRTLRASPTGLLYLAGDFTTANSLTLPDKAAIWNGSTFVAIDVDMPGAAAPQWFTTAPDGTLYMGFDTFGTGVASGVTTVTNTGTARAYPVITVVGPTTGTSRLYQLWNVTTGKYLYLNYTISAGETLTIRMAQGGPVVVSSWTSVVVGAILPGSAPDFALGKGDNTISFYSASSTVTATIQWAITYQRASDLTDN
jgi:hypothetical protein